jgi:hypothetical protein
MDMWLSWLFKIAGSRTARQPHVIYHFSVFREPGFPASRRTFAQTKFESQPSFEVSERFQIHKQPSLGFEHFPMLAWSI